MEKSHSGSLSHQLSPLLLLLLLLMALRLTYVSCSPFAAAQQLGRDFPPLNWRQLTPGSGQCPTPLTALLRLASHTTGGPKAAQFLHATAATAAAATICRPMMRARMLAAGRLTPLLTAAAATAGSPPSPQMPAAWRSFSLATDGATVRLHMAAADLAGQPPLLLHSNRRQDRWVFAISERRQLGLALTRCEKLPSGSGDALLARGARRHLAGASLTAGAHTVLHFAYSRDWQLWLGRGAVHEVRVLHAGSGACAVQRSWQLARNGTDGQPVLVELAAREFQFWTPPGGAKSAPAPAEDVGSESEFRLPTACYREEL